MPLPSAARRFVLLGSAIARAVGPRAALRAIPLFVAVATLSAVVFGGNGMRAADLAHQAHAALAVRISLWTGWLFLVVPVARVILADHAAHFLRPMPSPRSHFVTAHAAFLCLASVPFAALFAAGEGLTSSIASMLGASACASLVVARPARALEWIAALAMIALVVLGAPAFVMAPVAIVALAIGVGGAWDRAPIAPRGTAIERAFAARRALDRRASIRSTIAGPPALALAIAHLHSLPRTESAALRRSLFAAVVGGVVFALAAKNNGVHGAEELATLGLVVGALPLGIACGGLAGPLLDAERTLRWLLDAAGTTATTRARAATLATAIAGLGSGLVFGTAATLASTGASREACASVLVVSAGMGGAIGALAAAWARRADRPLGVDGSSLVAAMIGTILATMVIAHLLGTWALPLLAIIAIIVAARSVRYVARLHGASR